MQQTVSFKQGALFKVLLLSAHLGFSESHHVPYLVTNYLVTPTEFDESDFLNVISSVIDARFNLHFVSLLLLPPPQTFHACTWKGWEECSWLRAVRKEF